MAQYSFYNIPCNDDDEHGRIIKQYFYTISVGQYQNNVSAGTLSSDILMPQHKPDCCLLYKNGECYVFDKCIESMLMLMVWCDGEE